MVVLVTAVPLMAQQDPQAPVVLGAARPFTPAEAASRMSGTWKLNEELSPLPRAGSSPTAGAVPSRGGGARGGGGTGGGGRPGGGRGVTGGVSQAQQQELRVRALYRELNVRPSKLVITASAGTAKFVDEDDSERIVTINNKKDKLDLGTAILDSKTYWNGSALTIELDAGSQVKLYEVFELSPTGRQLLVTFRTEEGSNPRTGQLRGNLQRVYDRMD